MGSWGEERIEETRPKATLVVAADVSFVKPKVRPAHITLQKRQYDLFSHPAAEAVIAYLGAQSRTFVVYGVATDYCVRAAVLGLRSRNVTVKVVVDAIRAVNHEAEPGQIADFLRAGATLCTCEQLITEQTVS